MKLLPTVEPSLTDIQAQGGPEALADMDTLEAIMNRAVAKMGRADPATVAQQLELDYKAYFAERLPGLLGDVARLKKEEAVFLDEARRIQNDLDNIGRSATRQTLGWPKECLERLTIVGGLSLGLLIVVLDWTSTMEFLLPMTDNRRIALFLSGLIFSLPLLEGYYYLRAKEEKRERALSRQWPLTFVFGFLWLVVLLSYGNQANTSFFSPAAKAMEFVPVLRGILQVLTASLAAGVAFLIAVGPFLRLPAVSLAYIATKATLDAALEKASKAAKAAEPVQGRINRIQALLEAFHHKAQARLEHIVRINAELIREKELATDSIHH